jgi:hypothetical protein
LGCLQFFFPVKNDLPVKRRDLAEMLVDFEPQLLSYVDINPEI